MTSSVTSLFEILDAELTEEAKVEKKILEHEDRIRAFKKQKMAHYTKIIRLRAQIKVQLENLNRVLNQ